MSLRETQEQFRVLSDAMIAGGLLTEHERDVIARVGTRKVGYWRRHLDDLRSVLTRRLAERTKPSH